MSNSKIDKNTLDYILNLLRRGTTKWSGRTICLNKIRKRFCVGKHKNGKDKWIWRYHCVKCTKWFRVQDMEVDHIIEVGPYEGDIHAYAVKMYCEQENLQALCKWCHLKKTNSFNAVLRYKRKGEDIL